MLTVEAGIAGRLAEHGIELHRPRPGENRAACPRCAEIKYRPGDDALAIRLDQHGGAVWTCHRCGWRDGIAGPGYRPARGQIGARPSRRPLNGDFRLAGQSLDPTPRRLLSEPLRRLWADCRPITPHDPAGWYLVGRGCAVPPADADLRWHPSLKHPSGARFCGLVALVVDPVTGEPMNLHFTFLDGRGGKAPVTPLRRFAKGHDKAGGVCRLTPPPEVTTRLCLAEGLETALSVALVDGPAWATLDRGNLATFPLLDGIEVLTVYSDGDPDGQAAADQCCERWHEAGAEVLQWRSPVDGEDFNDHWRRVAAGELRPPGGQPSGRQTQATEGKEP